MSRYPTLQEIMDEAKRQHTHIPMRPVRSKSALKPIETALKDGQRERNGRLEPDAPIAVDPRAGSWTHRVGVKRYIMSDGNVIVIRDGEDIEKMVVAPHVLARDIMLNMQDGKQKDLLREIKKATKKYNEYRKRAETEHLKIVNKLKDMEAIVALGEQRASELKESYIRQVKEQIAREAEGKIAPGDHWAYQQGRKGEAPCATDPKS